MRQKHVLSGRKPAHILFVADAICSPLAPGCSTLAQPASIAKLTAATKTRKFIVIDPPSILMLHIEITPVELELQFYIL